MTKHFFENTKQPDNVDLVNLKQRLIFRYEKKQKSENEYESTKRVHLCIECHNCPFVKGKDTKSITVSLENQKQCKEVRDRLVMQEGKGKYKQRKIDVEPVFGQIKHNR